LLVSYKGVLVEGNCKTISSRGYNTVVKGFLYRVIIIVKEGLKTDSKMKELPKVDPILAIASLPYTVHRNIFNLG
jgi:hypothetical protein